MNYIVMDLEWNQSNSGLEEEVERLPFEIIEIGAVKLNDRFVMVGEYNELVKPVVYHEMHYITSKLIHLQMKELERGRDFKTVSDEFVAWCEEDEPYIFCTWGSTDLLELQRNMAFFESKAIGDGPIQYLDVQKLYALLNKEGKTRRSLEYAVDALEIEKDIPFHRAFSDAYYTAKVFQKIVEKDPSIIRFVSFDVYNAPRDKKEEVKIQFDDYNKYITRRFKNKTLALADRELSSCKCFICRRNLKKKVRWFTINSKNYLCLAYCEKHGFFKGKIRFHKDLTNQVFAVKTVRLVSQSEADEVLQKAEHAKEMKKRAKKSKTSL